MADYSQYANSVTHIILNTTNQCNFRCRMCFCDWNEYYMTEEIADRAIELALSRKDPNTNKLSVTFFGGEPLLNFPLIQYVTNKWKDRCSFTITTNGSLLTDEILQFLKENEIVPLLSIDGAKETQDYNRPFKDSDASTFDVLLPKLPRILECFPNTTFRSTIIPETAGHLFENYMFAKEQGFKNYFCTPDAYSNWDEESQRKLIAEALLITCEIIRGIVAGEDIVLPQFIINGLVNHLDVKSNIIQDRETVMRCGLGLTGFGVGANGIIVACQEHGTITDPNDIFAIGDVWHGIDEEKHARLLDKYMSERAKWREENCLDCPNRPACIKSACPSRQIFMYKNFNVMAEADCLWTNTCEYCASFMFNYFAEHYSENFIKLLDHLLDSEGQELIVKEIARGGEI